MARNWLSDGGRDGAGVAPSLTLADAWDVLGPALRRNAADTWAAVQDPATWTQAARAYGEALLVGTSAPGEGAAGGILAYHGSPHSFDRFDLSRIGTGEGAQAYGHGLYFADREGVARSYRQDQPTYGGGPYNSSDPAHRAAFYLDRHGGDRAATLKAIDAEEAKMAARPDFYAEARARLAEMRPLVADLSATLPEVKSSGHMYEVKIAADPARFLEWDAPRDKLAPGVQKFAQDTYPAAWEQAADGSSLYQIMTQHALRERNSLEKMLANKRAEGDTRPFPEYEARLKAMSNPQAYVSEQMRAAGIPGIRYLDGGSRGAGAGTYNHVVFDDNLVAILKKYGIAGLFVAGGAAGVGQASDVAGTGAAQQAGAK